MLRDATTLNPAVVNQDRLATLKAAWARTRRVRVEGLMRPGLAAEVAAMAVAGEFSFEARHVNEVRCVLWSQTHRWPAGDRAPASTVLMALVELLTRDIPALAQAITGQRVWRARDEGFAFHWYTKGCYLDAHTDQGSDRALAFVVGLTKQRWAATRGGHLEFLAPDEQTVVDTIPPGFDTLDLFCIYPLTRPHRIPILKDSVRRLSINGWLAAEPRDPRED